MEILVIVVLAVAATLLGVALARTVGLLGDARMALEANACALMDATEALQHAGEALEIATNANTQNMHLMMHIAEQTGAQIDFHGVTVN